MSRFWTTNLLATLICACVVHAAFADQFTSGVIGIDDRKPLVRPWYLSGVIGRDDRKPTDSWDEPWNAVGKIYAPQFSQVNECTGTLIDPKIVVTAAHCLFNPLTEKPMLASQIHFLAGYRREKYIAHSVGKCLKFNPHYKYHFDPSLEDASADYAFIVLKNSIKTFAVPIYDRGMIYRRDRLVHAGYGEDRRHLLSVHVGCSMYDYVDNVYLNDCDTNPGQSGGPIFVKKNGKHYIIGVMSIAVMGPTRQSQRKVNLAPSILPIRRFLNKIRDCK